MDAGISLSKDGRQLVFETPQERSILQRIAFGPQRGATVGGPATVLGVSRLIRDHHPRETFWLTSLP